MPLTSLQASGRAKRRTKSRAASPLPMPDWPAQERTPSPVPMPSFAFNDNFDGLASLPPLAACSMFTDGSERFEDEADLDHFVDSLYSDKLTPQNPTSDVCGLDILLT